MRDRIEVVLPPCDEAGDAARVILTLILELTERCTSLAELREIIEDTLV